MDTESLPTASVGTVSVSPAQPHHANGMRPIDRIRQAYAQARISVEVPEWGTPEQPFVVHFSPLTGSESEAVRARDPKTDAEYFAILLILKAKDDKGRPLFEMGDKHFLMEETPYAVIVRLAQQIQRQITLDDAKKNSETTPG